MLEAALLQVLAWCWCEFVVWLLLVLLQPKKPKVPKAPKASQDTAEAGADAAEGESFQQNLCRGLVSVASCGVVLHWEQCRCLCRWRVWQHGQCVLRGSQHLTSLDHQCKLLLSCYRGSLIACLRTPTFMCDHTLLLGFVGGLPAKKDP